MIEGYFIRKRDWQQIQSKYKEIAKEITTQFLSVIYNKINPIIIKIKKREINNYKSRSDFTSLCVVEDFDEGHLLGLVLQDFEEKAE